MSNWRLGGHGLHVVCFNTQLCRNARDRILTNHSRVSQLIIRQSIMLLHWLYPQSDDTIKCIRKSCFNYRYFYVV